MESIGKVSFANDRYRRSEIEDRFCHATQFPVPTKNFCELLVLKPVNKIDGYREIETYSTYR